MARGQFSSLIGGTLSPERVGEAEGDAEGVAVAAGEAERTSYSKPVNPPSALLTQLASRLGTVAREYPRRLK